MHVVRSAGDERDIDRGVASRPQHANTVSLYSLQLISSDTSSRMCAGDFCASIVQQVCDSAVHEGMMSSAVAVLESFLAACVILLEPMIAMT